MPLDKLETADVQAVHKGFGADWRSVFDLKRALAKRRGTGMPGTGPVALQFKRWEKLLAAKAG